MGSGALTRLRVEAPLPISSTFAPMREGRRTRRALAFAVLAFPFAVLRGEGFSPCLRVSVVN